MTELPPIHYGVWIKGHGWLKATNHNTQHEECLRFLHVTVAHRVAQRVGGRVEPIDDSLVDLEDNLKDIEKRRSIKWRMNVLFNKAKA